MESWSVRFALTAVPRFILRIVPGSNTTASQLSKKLQGSCSHREIRFETPELCQSSQVRPLAGRKPLPKPIGLCLSVRALEGQPRGAFVQSRRSLCPSNDVVRPAVWQLLHTTHHNARNRRCEPQNEL